MRRLQNRLHFDTSRSKIRKNVPKKPDSILYESHENMKIEWKTEKYYREGEESRELLECSRNSRWRGEKRQNKWESMLKCPKTEGVLPGPEI